MLLALEGLLQNPLKSLGRQAGSVSKLWTRPLLECVAATEACTQVFATNSKEILVNFTLLKCFLACLLDFWRGW